MTDLQALISKLEQAEEGSRKLDGEIAVVLRIFPAKAPWADTNFPNWACKNGMVYVVHDDGKSGLNWQAANYTTSLDAKLPGENIVSVQRLGDEWRAEHLHEDDGISTHAFAKTEPLARRLAALKAMADG